MSRRRVSKRSGVIALLLALVVATTARDARAVPAAATTAGKPGSSEGEAIRLPRFQGRTLDGKTVSIADFAGKRLILFCFNPGIEQAEAYAKALNELAPERTRHNFAIAGVALGLDPADAKSFASKLKLDFPIFDDSDGTISGGLGLQSPLVLIGSDPDGRVGLALFGFEHEDLVPADAVESRLREYLRLPPQDAASRGKLDQLPKAPSFEATRLDGGKPIRLDDLSGKPVVLTFFLSTCGHCQQALRFFKAELARMPEKSRPVFIGVATDSRTYAVKDALAEKQIDFFPILDDSDRKIATAYGAFAGVPDIVMIDAQGRIAYRTSGWNEQRDPDLLRMRLARIAGTNVPMLLAREGYSGNDACAVCHPTQSATWHFTDHSVAFDSLVTGGADDDAKCVGCHVVGFGERGGYSQAAAEGSLENVGCEVCHGRGGGHLDAKAKPAGSARAIDYRPVCVKCHDSTHSLGFDYATFLPKVSHAALVSLGDAGRAKLVENRGQPRDLLPATANIVGSAACERCHQKEYSVWSGSAHARSVEVLRKRGKEDDPTCVRCHVTGYGRPGGFPEKERARSGDDLARVGCESCHGPGGDHVRDEGRGGIVRLGDKCDSCVILQICGACHDDANDPGFRFEVPKKIEAQRHGTPRPKVAAAH